MKPLPIRVVLAFLLVAASCLETVILAGPVTGAEATAPALLQRLQSLAFAPPDDQSFQQSASALLAAIGRLQQSSDATDREQLQWLGIPEHSDDSPQSEQLTRLLDDDKQLRQLQIQLEQDFAPFEQPRYQQLREAVDKYRRLRHARATSDLRHQFDQRRQRLTQSLSRWVATRDNALYEPLREHVRWLEEHVQGQELVQQMRAELSHPNLIVHLPAETLAHLSRRTLSQSDPFSQRTRQLQTSGTSRFDGSAQLLPRIGPTPLRLDCPGTVQLATKSHLGPFRFDSLATTRVHGQLDLDVTEQGLRLAAAPTVAAWTNLRVGQVHARRSGPLPRLAGRMVDGALARRSDEAASQISSTVRDRLRDEIERLAAEQLEQINAIYEQRIAAPATRLLMWPRAWQVTADSRAVTLRLTEDRHCGLAAPLDQNVNGDPAVDGERDVAGDLNVNTPSSRPSLAVHESFATDLLNALFRGQNWPRDLDANGLQSFNDQLPIPLFESREFLPETRLRLQLHARRPFHVRFSDHRICLVLRAERMVLDEREVLGGQLELAFRLSAEGQHLVLRREGQPRLLLGDDPSITAERARQFEAVCRDELLAAMKNEVTIPAVVETEGWSVRPDRLDSRSGWFTLVARFGGNSP